MGHYLSEMHAEDDLVGARKRDDVTESKTENVGCWYCDGIESHGIATVKTVYDEFGRALPAYDTPYNYCSNCGRKLKED